MRSEGPEREAALGLALSAIGGLASVTVRREGLTAACLSI